MTILTLYFIYHKQDQTDVGFIMYIKSNQHNKNLKHWTDRFLCYTVNIHFNWLEVNSYSNNIEKKKH